jgi:hypothetical protein
MTYSAALCRLRNLLRKTMELADLIEATFKKHGIADVYVKSEGESLLLGWDGPEGKRTLLLEPGLTTLEIEARINRAVSPWQRLPAKEG